MKGYVNIPKNIYVKRCSNCGARPIIALINEGAYVVKCPVSDRHYHTNPGMIDLEEWNRNNPSSNDYSLNTMSTI